MMHITGVVLDLVQQYNVNKGIKLFDDSDKARELVTKELSWMFCRNNPTTTNPNEPKTLLFVANDLWST
jgi:hypothetical protein